MKKVIAILFIFALSLVACAPKGTVTLPPPTDTPIPLPTLHPQFIALQEQIAQSGRFTLNPNGTIQDGTETIPGLIASHDGTMTLIVDGQRVTLDPEKAVFDNEKGFSYPDYEQNADGDWVEASAISETAVTTTIEGNKFSGVGIELDGNNYENSPMLNQGDLPAMGEVLIQLYEEGKIKQYVDKEGGYSHPMQLGTDDLVMLGENSKFITNHGWQPMYEVKQEDRNTFVWDDAVNRPRVIGFEFDIDKDGKPDGVIFASMILNKDKKIDVGDWLYATKEWIAKWNGGRVGDLTEYKNTARNGMLVPLDARDVDACVEFVGDELVRTFCEEVVATRTERRALQQQKLTTGYVPEELSSGGVISLASGMPVSK